MTRHRSSGRFVLRIDPGLHAALRRAAATAGLSLNTYCARRLAAPSGGGRISLELAGAIERAAMLAGDHLIGVAVYGSWARGELSDRSDVDVLVVVDDALEISRALIARWDEAPIDLDGRPVEPMFAHLPASDTVVAGVWAEVALDGVVIFDPELRLSARLTRVRGDIVEGRVIRRSAHGQAYWTRGEAA